MDDNVDVDGSGDDRILMIYNRLPSSFAQDQYLLTNPDIDRATGYGLEISARWTRGPLWLSFGSTASIGQGAAASTGFLPIENDHGVLGELFINPNAASYARGRLFSDRAFTIKLMGVYRFPYDIRLGGIARYQDGQPFARVVVMPGLEQGVEAVRAVRNGDHRFTFTGTLDLRLQKGFPIGSRRVEAVFDAYNVFDFSYEVEERVVTGDAFRQISAVQPPRSFSLGVRVAF
jgi:outer membrane receptor protein involved in Fe transport